MSRERVERVIRGAYAARVKGDLDAIMAHFAEAADFTLAGSVAASPIPLTATGTAAIREVMQRLVDSFDFMGTEIVDLIVEGDRAAVHTRVLLRLAGGGKEVQTDIVDIVRLEGDSIASIRQFTDTALAAGMLKG